MLVNNGKYNIPYMEHSGLLSSDYPIITKGHRNNPNYCPIMINISPIMIDYHWPSSPWIWVNSNTKTWIVGPVTPKLKSMIPMRSQWGHHYHWLSMIPASSIIHDYTPMIIIHVIICHYITTLSHSIIIALWQPISWLSMIIIDASHDYPSYYGIQNPWFSSNILRPVSIG